MIGAIAGDIIGSFYERCQIKTKDFPLFHPRCCFTDDSVLTVAIAKAILSDHNYLKAVWETGRKYPTAGGTVLPCESVQSVLPSTPQNQSSRKRHAQQKFRITTLKVLREQEQLLWPFFWPGQRETNQ